MKNIRWSSVIIHTGENCDAAWKACKARATNGSIFQIVPATSTEYIVEFSSGHRTVFRWFSKSEKISLSQK